MFTEVVSLYGYYLRLKPYFISSPRARRPGCPFNDLGCLLSISNTNLVPLTLQSDSTSLTLTPQKKISFFLSSSENILGWSDCTFFSLVVGPRLWWSLDCPSTDHCGSDLFPVSGLGGYDERCMEVLRSTKSRKICFFKAI